ncbi:MAG: pyridoxal 5'-phosphate synthase glutaminase subunit PdxT [Chloroflexi bacterium]|nr:pyridoxal 5'-phosphate synthase glutaminase subunit PdxT [Chloroflexota bacterium]
MTKVGVLALQGAVVEHVKMLQALGIEARQVKLPEQLDGIDGLVIPGGESTTIGKLLVSFNLLDKLLGVIAEGVPVLGTCAGMILLARATSQDFDQPLIGAMDIVVRRNGFGRQVDSFETDLRVPVLGERPFRAIFIRAPYIERVGEQASIVATLGDGKVVAARQGNLLACAFHPELGADLRFHQYFSEIISMRQVPTGR